MSGPLVMNCTVSLPSERCARRGERQRSADYASSLPRFPPTSICFSSRSKPQTSGPDLPYVLRPTLSIWKSSLFNHGTFPHNLHHPHRTGVRRIRAHATKVPFGTIAGTLRHRSSIRLGATRVQRKSGTFLHSPLGCVPARPGSRGRVPCPRGCRGRCQTAMTNSP